MIAVRVGPRCGGRLPVVWLKYHVDRLERSSVQRHTALHRSKLGPTRATADHKRKQSKQQDRSTARLRFPIRRL